MHKKQRTGVIRDYDMHSLSVRIGYGLIYGLCIVMMVFAVFPLIWVVLAGFKDLKEFMSSTSLLPRSFDLGLFLKTWNQLGIAKNYLNSLISVVGSVICALIFNGLLGYGLAILKPRGYSVVKKMVFIQFFESLPQSMIEASRIDGCTPLQTFFHIVLPLSKPICAVVSIFAINAAWSDFLLPYLVLRGGPLQTVMVRLFVFSTEQTVNADTMMRSVVFSMIPPIILFALFQKQLTENAVSAGIKG